MFYNVFPGTKLGINMFIFISKLVLEFTCWTHALPFLYDYQLEIHMWNNNLLIRQLTRIPKCHLRSTKYCITKLCLQQKSKFLPQSVAFFLRIKMNIFMAYRYPRRLLVLLRLLTIFIQYLLFLASLTFRWFYIVRFYLL